MVGHDESGSSEKSLNDLPTFNAENMQNNMKPIYYSRTFMSIIGGVVAGISGFTGLIGLDFYFLVMAITSIGLIDKAGFTIHSYFDSWNQIIFDDILGVLMPNIYVHHWWGHCWNFGVYRLDRICLLFPCHGNYFNRTHCKGWVYDPFILRFMEPDYI